MFDKAIVRLTFRIGQGVRDLCSQRQAACERTSDGYREDTHSSIEGKVAIRSIAYRHVRGYSVNRGCIGRDFFRSSENS